MFLGVLETIIGLVLVRLARKSSSKFFFERKARARNFLFFRGQSERETGSSRWGLLPEPETRSEEL